MFRWPCRALRVLFTETSRAPSSRTWCKLMRIISKHMQCCMRCKSLVVVSQVRRCNQHRKMHMGDILCKNYWNFSGFLQTTYIRIQHFWLHLHTWLTTANSLHLIRGCMCLDLIHINSATRPPCPCPWIRTWEPSRGTGWCISNLEPFSRWVAGIGSKLSSKTAEIAVFCSANFQEGCTGIKVPFLWWLFSQTILNLVLHAKKTHLGPRWHFNTENSANFHLWISARE